jgi:hypothetical protein
MHVDQRHDWDRVLIKLAPIQAGDRDDLYEWLAAALRRLPVEAHTEWVETEGDTEVVAMVATPAGLQLMAAFVELLAGDPAHPEVRAVALELV